MENSKVTITKNGITTLATAGKYCAANVDVVVDVPAVDPEELTAQRAIEDSLVKGTVQHYSNDRITYMRSYAFFAQDSLVSVSIRKVRTVGLFAFSSCSSLVQVDMPAATGITDSAFSYCSQLATVDLPLVEAIDIEAFRGCMNLSALVLRNAQVCILFDKSAFRDTPIASGTGFIYVPDDLVEQYKVATNWSIYASQIRPISELEE